MSQYLRVRLRCKLITLLKQHLLESHIIFNDSIMHHRDCTRRVGMRMRIQIARRAVRCPSGMSDTGGSRHCLSALCQILKHLKSADRLLRQNLCAVKHSHARRIISPVLQL